MLVSNLVLLRPYEFSLSPLVSSILPDEAQASIHLRETLGTKDEHQLILYRTALGEIAHRLNILCLTLFKLLFQGAKL